MPLKYDEETMKPETWVAIYAAVVGTGALLLNFKAWLNSGVKLSLNLVSHGMTLGGGPQTDENDLIILNIVNRGDASTQIISMVLLEFDSTWRLWRMRPNKSYFIPNPQLKGYPQNVPSDLEPGKRWSGVIRQRPDVIADMRTGRFYAGIYTTARDKPFLAHIPLSKPSEVGSAARL